LHRFAAALAFLMSVAVFGGFAFYAVEADPDVTLSLQLDVQTSEPSSAQVYWNRGQGMREEDSFRFSTHRGVSQYVARVPVDLRALRIHPLATLGVVHVRRIALETHGVPIRRWGGARGFAGWQPVSRLIRFEERAGVLTIESDGRDPSFEFHGLARLRSERRAIHRWVSLVVGVVCAGLYAGLTRLALPPGRDVVQTAAPPARGALPGSRQMIPIGQVTLFLLSSVLSVGLGYVVYQRFIAVSATPAAAPLVTDHYRPTLVDQWGRPLTERRGDLQLMLDPFTLYRNFPNQRTSHFAIDANGFRGSGAEARGAPGAVVLGGSAAFGMGLGSDGETFTARLNVLDPDHRWVNAAVVGFLSGQELSQMMHYADRLEPKLYIAFDGWNEQYSQLFPEQVGREFGYNWAMFEMLQDRLFQFVASEVPPGSSGLQPLVPRPAFDPAVNQERIFVAYARNLKRMADFGRSRGAVFQPHLGKKRRLVANEGPAWGAWRKAHQTTHGRFVEQYDALIARARAYSEAERIPFLDLNQSPRLLEHPDALFVDAVHLNAVGHQIVAELINERLRRLGDGIP
jgi:hypothetical protein